MSDGKVLKHFGSGGMTASGITWRSSVWRWVDATWDQRMKAAMEAAYHHPSPNTILASGDAYEAFRATEKLPIDLPGKSVSDKPS